MTAMQIFFDNVARQTMMMNTGTDDDGRRWCKYSRWRRRTTMMLKHDEDEISKFEVYTL